MAFQSINPKDSSLVKEFETWGGLQLEQALQSVAKMTPLWAETPMSQRCDLMRAASKVLLARKEQLAGMITLEMGKLFREAIAEVEKCALVCDFYADHGPAFLEDELLPSDAGKSYLAYLPLGTVLAVMPWNFPLWQVFRFAVPALIAGNTGVLKHASNVPQCALAIEQVFLDAGFPEGGI